MQNLQTLRDIVQATRGNGFPGSMPGGIPTGNPGGPSLGDLLQGPMRRGQLPPTMQRMLEPPPMLEPPTDLGLSETRAGPAVVQADQSGPQAAPPAGQPSSFGPPPAFDYEAARRELLGDEKLTGWDKAARVAGVIGSGLMAAGGLQPTYPAFVRAEQERKAQTLRDLMEMQYRDFERQDETRQKLGTPFSSGRDRVRIDPMTGKPEVLFDGSEDFETYAETLGLVPGSAEYFAAVEDYVLRGHGPTAFGRSQEIDDYRTENDIRAENIRHRNRASLRQTPTYRDVNGPPARRSGGASASGVVAVKTVAEAMALPSGTKFRTPDGRVKIRP